MTKKNSVKQDVNLISLVERYNNEEKCRAYLEELRWPNGLACPRCGVMSISRIQKHNIFECNSCRYQFSVTSGTVFHDSHLPLWKWFATVYLMIESKKGISANQVKRTIGVSYKTAWYLCHRVRAAMSEVNPKPLSGIVEVDETYIGGVKHRHGKGYRANKVVVAAAVQRGGPSRLQVVEGTDRLSLHNFIHQNTAPETEAIYTDDLRSYDGVEDADTRHEIVNHSHEQWVHGDVHTNHVENIWSLLKRSIVGSYHKVSVKHLNAYLDELEWRFNNRDNPYLFRDTILKLIKSDNLPYEQLTSETASQKKSPKSMMLK